jgi:hypothetical protein
MFPPPSTASGRSADMAEKLLFTSLSEKRGPARPSPDATGELLLQLQQATRTRAAQPALIAWLALPEEKRNGLPLCEQSDLLANELTRAAPVPGGLSEDSASSRPGLPRRPGLS